MATLIIGLGNPGGEYAHTRHNIGWACLEVLERIGKFGRERKEGPAKIREGSLDGYDVVLARPQTFMNLSGRAGHHLTEKLGVLPADVIVVHDEIDLPLGRIRIRFGGSAAGNRGVKSLMDSWRTQEFIRVRIGVGHPGSRDGVIDHVLERFTPDERPQVDEAVKRAADAVTAIVSEGIDGAMNRFNRVPDR